MAAENSRDFRDVCALALLNPTAIRERAQHLAAAGWPLPATLIEKKPAERGSAGGPEEERSFDNAEDIQRTAR